MHAVTRQRVEVICEETRDAQAVDVTREELYAEQYIDVDDPSLPRRFLMAKILK